MYRISADTIGFTTGGSLALTIANNNAIFAGSVSIGSTVAPSRSLDVRGNGIAIIGTGGYTELMLRGQVEGTGTVRNLGAWQLSIRSDVGGDNDDLKFLRNIAGVYQGIAMQIQNSTGDIFFGNTVVNPASGFSTIRGLGYDNSTGNLEVASTSGTAMSIGRNESSDGQILQLRKESNIKHSFGSTDSYLLGNVGIGTTVATGGFNVNSTTAGSYYNMSNVDSGNYKYTNAGGRLLTSNATGWFADGRDPILTLSSSGNSENSAIGNSIGLNLYTNSYTYNNFSPLITFSALSDSGSYASAYAAIAGRKTNRGPDTNWNTGDLCFWTTGPEASNPASYMQQTPTMVIKSGGNVGINENSPDAKLHVMGTTGLPATSGTAFTGTMRLGVSGGYGTVMDFGAVGPSTGTQWIQVTDSSDQSYQYPLLLQPNGGDVGIGTASPNRKLHVAGKAIVGQTANYSSNAGMMHVYGDNSENSGILDIASNGNGRYYTRVCWNKTSTSQAGYWHIKTNVPIGGNVMFMAKFYGYIYGSAQVLDLTHAGYAYSGTNTVINQGVQNNGNNVNSSSAYYTSAGGSKLCFRVAFGAGATFSTYFAGVFMDMAFPSPAGAAFDFEIEAQSFSQNTTVY